MEPLKHLCLICCPSPKKDGHLTFSGRNLLKRFKHPIAPILSYFHGLRPGMIEVIEFFRNLHSDQSKKIPIGIPGLSDTSTVFDLIQAAQVLDQRVKTLTKVLE